MKNKRTIAIISTTAFTISSFFLSHIKRLSKYYNLLIICNDVIKLKKKVPKDVLLYNLNFYRKPNFFIDIKTFLILTYLLLKIRPTLTLSISPKAGFLNSISSYLARIPYRIHWFTGQVWITKKGLAKNFYMIIDKLIFFFSKHVLVDSHSQRKFLISNNIISKKKSTVLLKGSVGGVNIKKFQFKYSDKIAKRKKFKILKNNFVILYLGRINKDKGLIDLIEAFKKIQNQNKIFLILVGPVEDDRIKNLIKDNKRIIYSGETSTPEKWFSIADIFCLPSYREGFGTTIIQAASCGIPALVSNIYGISDAVIKNKTGFFHKVGDVNDMKKKILYVIKNKNLVKKYGKNARKMVKINFDENLLTKKLCNFIKSKIN